MSIYDLARFYLLGWESILNPTRVARRLKRRSRIRLQADFPLRRVRGDEHGLSTAFADSGEKPFAGFGFLH